MTPNIRDKISKISGENSETVKRRKKPVMSRHKGYPLLHAIRAYLEASEA